MSKQIQEEIEPGLHFTYELKKVLESTRSQWQDVDFIETGPFGKALLLDGLMQSAELDEYVYHECLVHPAMLAHPNPKRVFIGGGGEGSTAREVLRHKSVEECVMVDIDGDVVDFCRTHLESNKEAFESKRLNLIIDDAKKQLEEWPDKFDVIIMDLDDPLEGGPCYWLYTQSFYEMCKSKLNEGGILVTQSSAAGVKAHKLVFSPVHKTLSTVFPTVLPYSQAVYSFCDEWGWNMGFTADNVKPLSVDEVDARIADRIDGELRFLDGISYQGIFSLSKAIRKTLAEETHILSKENPAFLHGSGINSTEQQS